MRRILWLSAPAMLLWGAGFVPADEEKVALAEVPKPILETVKARFKGADLKGAARETEDGKLVYEVTIAHKGQKIDVTLSPEGELLMIEKTIAAKDLPDAVARALKGKYPGATYKIVEEIVKVEKKKETLAYYEVLLVKADKSALEVQVNAAGKVVNEEKKEPGKDDD